MDDWQERLSEAMQSRGMSGGELARRTGFTSQYINSLRTKDRGARLPLDTARKLAAALGVTVEWLTKGEGTRDRLSDVYPVHVPPSSVLPEPYPSRAEAIALIASLVEPEVIAALRATTPPNPSLDPGRDFWLSHAKDLARDFRRIKADPGFARGDVEGDRASTRKKR
jgi:transcriptional regulator with XRE-family HTH domain